MADNVAITAGAGTTVAADDIAGVMHQRVKISQGADGSATDVSSAAPLNVTLANGTVPSHAVTNAGTFAVQVDGNALTALQLIDDTVATLGTTTYTETTTKGTIVGAVRRDADTTLVDTTNEVGPLQMDANGRLKVEAFSGETLPVSDAGSSLTVDNGGTFAVQISASVPGTGATNLGKAEDAAHSSGDVGVMALAVRQDTQSDFGADGDYVPLSIDADGALRVSGGGGGTQYTEDAAAAADPVGNMMLAVRRDTLSASEVSADGDNVAIKATRKGQAHVYAQIDSTQLGSLGQAAMAASAPVVIASDQSAVSVVPTPATSGGLSVVRKIDLDETPVAVKAAAGQLYGFSIANLGTATRYLRFYNVASGSVTVGTTAATVGPLTIPANASDDTVVMLNFGGQGIAFGTAISMAATTGFADNDTGAPGANELMINVFYK
jgi:hypothetical protein